MMNGDSNYEILISTDRWLRGKLCTCLHLRSHGRRDSWWRMTRCWETSHKYYLFTYKGLQAVTKENWLQQMQGNVRFP